MNSFVMFRFEMILLIQSFSITNQYLRSSYTDVLSQHKLNILDVFKVYSKDTFYSSL